MRDNGRNGLGPGEPIFYGRRSEQLWSEVVRARTPEELSYALYSALCKCQVLESRVESIEEALRAAVREAGDGR